MWSRCVFRASSFQVASASSKYCTLRFCREYQLPQLPHTTTHVVQTFNIQHRARAWHVFLVQSNTFGLHISSLMPSYSIGTLVLSETTTEGLYDLSLSCYLQVFRNSDSFRPSPLRQLFGVSLLCLPFYSSAATLLNNQYHRKFCSPASKEAQASY